MRRLRLLAVLGLTVLLLFTMCAANVFAQATSSAIAGDAQATAQTVDQPAAVDQGAAASVLVTAPFVTVAVDRSRRAERTRRTRVSVAVPVVVPCRPLWVWPGYHPRVVYPPRVVYAPRYVYRAHPLIMLR
jgi:hypothetical protein